MKWPVPDTVFTRLFGLVLAALLCSHLVMTALFMVFAPDSPPPENRRPQDKAQYLEAPPPDGARHPDDPPPGDHQPRGKGERRMPPEFWAGFAIQLAVVTLLAWYGARRLVRPIEQLTQGARELGRTLDSPPIDETGPLETRQAAQLFNDMRAKLRRQMDERSHFLAAVSHDLRTPLTRIRLRGTQIEDSTLQQRLNQDIDDMAAMLDATLAYLRDNSQQEHWEQLDIEALLQAMAEDAQELGQPVTFTGQASQLRTLPATLRRCLDNLLENALRYGVRADISLQQSDTTVEICIRDHGPGIPEAELARVFEPFVRLEDSRNRHTGGTGLGLTIARDAARRMGGELYLSNAGSGGLIALLVLPR